MLNNLKAFYFNHNFKLFFQLTLQMRNFKLSSSTKKGQHLEPDKAAVLRKTTKTTNNKTKQHLQLKLQC